MSMTLSETMKQCYEARELPAWGDILNAADELDRLSRQLAEAQAERGQLYAEIVKLRTVLDRALQHILGTWPRGDMVRQISDCLSPERPAHAAAMGTTDAP